jgi:uncharacterized protein YqeY
MDIKAQIEKNLKDAMLAKDETRKSTLRLALSAVKLAEVEKRAPLTDDEVLGILQKEVKSRRETINDALRAGRQDLADAAETEITILIVYLPQPLSEAELETLARGVIEEVGAQAVSDMGKVMKVLMPRVNNRADGGQVSSTVQKLLST